MLLKVILPDTYFQFFLLSNIFRHIKCNFVNYCDDKNFVFFYNSTIMLSIIL